MFATYLLLLSAIAYFLPVLPGPEGLKNYSAKTSFLVGVYGGTETEQENIRTWYKELELSPSVKLRPIFVYLGHEFDSETVAGTADILTGACIILISKKTRRLKRVFLHETFHCYGFAHSENKNDIMHPFAGDEPVQKYINTIKSME